MMNILLILCTFLTYFCFFMIVNVERTSFLFLFFWLALITSIVGAFYCFFRIVYYYHVENEIKILSDIETMKEEHYILFKKAMQKESDKQTEALNQLKQLLEKNPDDAMVENKFNEIVSTFKTHKLTTYCEDSYVNAVLQSKKMMAEEKNIKINYDIFLPQRSNLEITVLPTILFNLLDNAISANQNAISKSISLVVRYNEFYISITQINSKSELKNRQNHNDLHGYGLEIVEDLVKKYDGRCDWIDLGDSFKSIIMLKYKRGDV